MNNISKIEALELLADEIYGEMENEAPCTEEWLALAEKFIPIQREINKLKELGEL